jgi:hypothetical protein
MKLEICATPHAEFPAVLEAAAIDVLETMFFADAMPAEADTPEIGTDALVCALEFEGALCGSFGVAVDRDALQVLCCAFYGEDGVASPAQVGDMLCELANMIAGSTLSRYVPGHSCKLSSPVVCEALPEIDDAIRLNLSIEGGLLAIWCTLRMNP